MPAIDFPASSASPYTAPNGVIYTWNDNGYWEADNDGSFIATEYLKLDASNGPVTGPLTFEGATTHEAGVEVTGGIDSVTTGVKADNNYFQLTNQSNYVLTHKSDTNQIRLAGNSGFSGQVAVSNSNHRTSFISTVNPANASADNDRPDGGHISIHGRTILNGAPARKHVSCFFASTGDNQNNANVENQYGYFFNNNLRTAFNNYGFYTNLAKTHHQGGVAFAFYSASDAPNYFGGLLNINSTVDTPGNGNTETGVVLGNSNRIFISSQNDTGLLVNRNTTGSVVHFKYNGGTGQAGNPSAGSISVTGTQRTVYNCGQNSVASGFVSDSDYRLKENIADLPSAVEAVKNLKPKTFNYIGSSETVQGFVAHELQEVNNFYATGTKDETEAIGTLADYNGTVIETEVTEPDASELEYTEEVETDGVTTMVTRTRSWTATGTRPVYQGVDQTKLIPLLTKALQEALDKIETLETRLSDAGIA